MADKYVLVLWTKLQQKNVIPETMFVKSFKENGKVVPLFEGAHRMVQIGENQHEAEIIRISSSKAYLESLLVTKDGQVLLHGSIPPSKHHLAKKSNLIDDEPEEKKKEREAMRVLNANAQEQPPNTLLDGYEECNHGCFNCCGTLPQFPRLPEGFVNTLVSLAEYFHHFHKSTAANIMVVTGALADLSAKLDTWQRASEEKVELKKGSGVWIEPAHLQRILGQAESASKKTPHQNLVKSLLTHLLGIQKYLETGAEKMDRRLLSAVAGYVNEKYPDLAQPVEKYYRCINLNRGYLLKRKHDAPSENTSHRGSVSDVGGLTSSSKGNANQPPRRQLVGLPDTTEDPKIKRARMAIQQSKENQEASIFKTSSRMSDQNQFSTLRNLDISVVTPGVSSSVLTGSTKNIPVMSNSGVKGSNIGVPVPSDAILSVNNLGRPMIAKTSNLIPARFPNANKLARPMTPNTSIVGETVISSSNNVARQQATSNGGGSSSSASSLGRPIISSTNNFSRPVVASTNNLGRPMNASPNNLGCAVVSSTSNLERPVISTSVPCHSNSDYPTVSCTLRSGDNVDIPVVPRSMLHDKNIGLPIATCSAPGNNITSTQIFYLRRNNEVAKSVSVPPGSLQPTMQIPLSAAFSSKSVLASGNKQTLMGMVPNNSVSKVSSFATTTKALPYPGRYSNSGKPQINSSSPRNSNMILNNVENRPRGITLPNAAPFVSSGPRFANIQNAAVNFNSSVATSMGSHGYSKYMSPSTNSTSQTSRASQHSTTRTPKIKIEHDDGHIAGALDITLSP